MSDDNKDFGWEGRLDAYSNRNSPYYNDDIRPTPSAGSSGNNGESFPTHRDNGHSGYGENSWLGAFVTTSLVLGVLAELTGLANPSLSFIFGLVGLTIGITLLIASVNKTRKNSDSMFNYKVIVSGIIVVMACLLFSSPYLIHFHAMH